MRSNSSSVNASFANSPMCATCSRVSDMRWIIAYLLKRLSLCYTFCVGAVTHHHSHLVAPNVDPIPMVRRGANAQCLSDALCVMMRQGLPRPYNSHERYNSSIRRDVSVMWTFCGYVRQMSVLRRRGPEAFADAVRPARMSNSRAARCCDSRLRGARCTNSSNQNWEYWCADELRVCAAHRHSYAWADL